MKGEKALNVHINKTTRLQPWEGRTVFGEYPVFIRPGNFTVTLMFHDRESIDRLCRLLKETVAEIDTQEFMKECFPTSIQRKDNR